MPFMTLSNEEFIKNVLGKHGLNELEAMLKPENASEVGFLGKNDSLVSTLLEDRATLNKLGVTYGQLAEEIDKLLDNKNWEELEGVGETYRGLVIMSSMAFGSQECPWECPKEKYRASGQYVAEPVETKDKSRQILMERMRNNSKIGLEYELKTEYNIIFTELSPHLIRDHKFFEGRGSPYRMEPAVLVKWFNL